MVLNLFSLIVITILCAGCTPYWIKDNSTFINSRYRNRDGIQQYVRNNSGMPREVKDSLLNSTVIVNMTQAEVLLVAGKPSKIRQAGSREVWIYSNPSKSTLKTKLFFEKEVLVEIEDVVIEPWF
jgi:hypothetical protein